MDRDYFINFNSRSVIHEKRRPIRHSYVYRGTSQLTRSIDNKRMFDENLQAHIFANCHHERGFNCLTLKDSHYLPIPFPRFMTKMSADGMIDHYQKPGQNAFV